MKQDFENPFADYGNIVRGERFIGRQDDLRVIANRVIRPRESGNLAIIGAPRIGKSSLVYEAILERKDDLIAQKLLPIWVNLATYDQAPIFFRSLVTRCVDYLEDLGWLSEPIRCAADHALQDELSWGEGYWRIQRFFEKVRQEQNSEAGLDTVSDHDARSSEEFRVDESENTATNRCGDCYP